MNLRDKIWDWAESLDDWQNDLLRRIYESGGLEENDLNEVKKNLFATLLELDLPHKIIRLQKTQIHTGINTDKPVRIKKLSNLKNVGNVAEDGSLNFLTDGLTIIYGENGTGKSSYARVLKKACRAIKQDIEIYSNAFEDTSGIGTAEIKIINDGNPEIIQRNVNGKPDPRLNSISIFDRECAEAYTEGKVLDIPYLPSDLRSLKQIELEQKKIQDSIEKEIKTLQHQIEGLNSKLDDFPKDNVIYPKISNLYHTTDLDQLAKLKGLKEKEQQELEEAVKSYADSDPTKIQKVIKEITSKKTDLDRIFERFGQIDELINKNLDEVFPDLISEINAFKNSQKLLREEFASDLSGTGNEAWKKLWNTAKNYSINHAYPEKEYPVLEVEGKKARCVLCQQTLDEKGVVNRLKRFEKYISDDIENQLKKIRIHRDEQMQRIKQLKLADLLTDQTRNLIDDHNLELLQSIDTIDDQLSNVKKQILKALKEEQWDDEINLVPIPIKEKLNNLISEFKNQIQTYEDLKKPSKREELGEKIKRLQAKNELDKSFETVKAIVEKERMVSLMWRACDFLKTRPISDFVSSLGSDIADNIKVNLLENLKQLRLSNLSFEIKGRGREAEAKSELLLKNKKGLSPNTILSDGEKNSTAIAYFLAEVDHTEHNGTLILDDPVTSLDDNRREYVAKIISKLAGKRQVIVFTHDIYFMTKLEKFCREYDIKPDYIYVERTSSNSGKAYRGLPFRRQSPSDMLKRPDGKLKHYSIIKEKIHPDESREIVEIFYLSLRRTWEAAIEKVFLGGIVQRYDSRIDVGGVARLTLTDEMKKDVSDGWSNSSEFLHFEGDLSSKALPSLEQMQNDFNALKKFINKYNQN